MTSPTNGDLGHGVRVMPGDGGRIVVQSAEFDLGWRPRVAEQPGSAVVWGGASFEVLEREPWGRGARWTLVPWTGEDVMRVVLPLDGAAVEAAARDARAAAREAALRPWFWLLSPVLGFASASAQRRWRDAWGFPATTATWLSAIFEFVLGGLCIVELMVASQAGVEIFSWIPRWLLFCGLPLCVEGLVRMKMVASDSEPIGSFFGLIGSVFERARKPTPEPRRLRPGTIPTAFSDSSRPSTVATGKNRGSCRTRVTSSPSIPPSAWGRAGSMSSAASRWRRTGTDRASA